MIRKENIFLDVDVNDYKELFVKMNDIFIKREYVSKKYLESILEREEKYPTGLNFKEYNIAIPHTDSKHINKQNIVFIRLKKHINFNEMGSIDNLLKVDLVFMLLIKKSDEQVNTLIKLMKILENKKHYLFFKNSKNEEEIYEYINKLFIDIK